MTAVEKALRDMIDRRPWEYLKKNHTQGTIYRSLEKYEPYMEQLYSDLCSKVTGLEQESKEAKQKVQDTRKLHEGIETKYKDLLKKRDLVSAEISTLEEEKNKTTEHLETLTSELEEVENKIYELGKRHITPENLTEILESDVESPDGLLDRVKTKTEHRAFVEQSQAIEESLNDSRKQEQEAASRLEQLTLDIQSEENKLDELKQRNRLWLNSIQVVNKAQRLGYMSDILVQILNALFKLAVVEEPILSARRLLRRFEKINEEIELDKSIATKTVALEAIKAHYDEVAGSLKAIKKDALEGVQAVEKTSKKILSGVEAAARIDIKTVTSQSLHSIRSVEQSAVESVEIAKESGCKAMGHLERNVAKVFMDNSFAFRLAMETYKTQVSEWGDLMEQAGRFTEQIKLATTLLGIQQNPEALRDIEPAIITRLAERIDLYINLRWPGVKTKASSELARNDFGISSLYQADLSSVSSWLVDALRKMERSGS